MGGSDDPSNLIELSVEEHADAHRKLYEEHKNHNDYVAWKSLLGCLDVDRYYETSRAGGLNNMGKPKSEEHKRKISEALKGRSGAHSESTKQKISERMEGNTNSKNHNSDEYKKNQSLAMKRAWEKRKKKSTGDGK
jgi:hypothetical protein